MAGQVTWKRAQIQKLVDAAKDDRYEDDLYLVKDDGIYLMVFRKKDVAAPKAVEYAHGCDPSKADVWDKCQRIMGGDDGGDTMGLSGFTELLALGASSVTIQVTATQLKLSGSIPTKKVTDTPVVAKKNAPRIQGLL